MIPILYKTVTEGIVPSDYGIGALTDCLSCSVKEDRNGAYELTMQYAAQGIHAAEIQPDRIIKAKPNFTDDPQLFRIYKVGKNMNGRFEVNAQHITYDLSGKVITGGSASTITGACALLQGNAGGFTITTDKSVDGAFKIEMPSSVRSWFGGKSGSLLDVYGTGEWHYDNFDCVLKLHRGANRGVEIRYGKNLTELSQTIDIQNLVTGIIPFYQDTDNDIQYIGTRVPTGLVSNVEKDIAIDFSSDCNIQSSVPMETQLQTLAVRYINNNILDRATSSITLDFVQLSSLEERVDLCDTVHIYFEALGISSELKCVSTTWDVLQERYTSTTFGDPKTDITDTIASQQEKLFENDTDVTSIKQEIVDNDVTFYNYTNADAITINPEVETTIASLDFISTKETTVKLLHEFIFDMTADLAKDTSYEIKYYLDGDLVDYSPYERVGTITQLTEGDLTNLSITRDFYYVINDVTPHERHVWKVNIVTHNVANTYIGAGNANVTLEGQRLFSESYFDGYIDAIDYLTVIALGSLSLVSISDSASVSLTDPNDLIKHEATDNLPLQNVGELAMLPIAEEPEITMQNCFPWATEDGDVWALEEDDDTWATE